MIKRLPLAVLVVLLLSVAEAPAKTPYVNERPTFQQGRDVMHTILDAYTRNTDGHLTLGVCRRRAKLWIACKARIDYRHTVVRYRFQIGRNVDDYVIGTNITIER